MTDALRYLWSEVKKLEPKVSENGGILAWKAGYHSPGYYNKLNWPRNYSIQHPRDTNEQSPGWDEASAFDWTFTDAQQGKYTTISKYTSRLLASGKDMEDPRLNDVRELYGCIDGSVRGWDTVALCEVTSDDTHLWHIHFSVFRDAANSMTAMQAILSVLKGETVQQWRATAGTEEEETMFYIKTADDRTVYISNGLTYRPLAGYAYDILLGAGCTYPLITVDTMEQVRLVAGSPAGGTAVGSGVPIDDLRAIVREEISAPFKRAATDA